MAVDWDEIQKALSPLKDYEDLCHRFTVSFGYPFVVSSFNFSMPQLVDYSRKLLGEDARNRYVEYLEKLIIAFSELDKVGVKDVLDLKAHTESREKLERFVEQRPIEAGNIILVCKYLIYWFFPGEKYLSGLVMNDPEVSDACKVLAGLGVRTNLQLLQQGITPAGRLVLARDSGLPKGTILDLVNRADLSRLPWASKATISNIVGVGYGSIARLAKADPQKLYADFFAYGRRIGKDLRLGNEIESSYRIARIVPVLVEED